MQTKSLLKTVLHATAFLLATTSGILTAELVYRYSSFEIGVYFWVFFDISLLFSSFSFIIIAGNIYKEKK